MENMRDMLRNSLGRSLATMSALDRLSAAWPVACGPALARRGVLKSFENGILLVEVTDKAWMDQLFGMRAVLEHDLARIAEVKQVEIHFVLTKLRRIDR